MAREFMVIEIRDDWIIMRELGTKKTCVLGI